MTGDVAIQYIDGPLRGTVRGPKIWPQPDIEKVPGHPEGQYVKVYEDKIDEKKVLKLKHHVLRGVQYEWKEI